MIDGAKMYKVALWGCGQYAQSFFNDFSYYRLELLDHINTVVDSNNAKVGGSFFGKKIESVDVLVNYGGIIVVGSLSHYNQIVQQIKLVCLSKNIEVVSLHYYLNYLIYSYNILPEAIKIDASTLCQLNCVECYMRKENYGAVDRGYLSFENFKKFVDCNCYIRRIELSNNGEIFLNPDLLQIIKYAFNKGIKLTARNGVNFNDVSDEVIEALVIYQFEHLTLSIDGATQETYKKYRKNGNIDKVLSNIKKLIDFKKKYNSEKPQLRWQYIIMEYTENDIGRAKTIAKEMGIPIFFKLTWDKKYVPKNRDYVCQETGLLSLTTTEYLKETDNYYGSRMCNQLFIEPQINWDGRLLGCCANYYADFGVNVFENGLKVALESETFRKAREMFFDPLICCDKNNPCALCGVHIHRQNKRRKSNENT